jgi:hypothetical protein
LTAWEAPSEISPKASIEPPGASGAVQIPPNWVSENFNPFPRIADLSIVYGQVAAKKIAGRALGGMNDA